MQNYLGYLFYDYSYIGKDWQESRDEGEMMSTKTGWVREVWV